MPAALAIVGATTLLGREIQDALERERSLWTELRLLSGEEEGVGTLTAVDGEAAVVRPLAEDALTGIDLAFVCSDRPSLEQTLEAAPEETAVIVLTPDAPPEIGTPVVAGVNLNAAGGSRILVSPHPGVIAASQLLQPLLACGIQRAVGLLVLPASMRQQDGLDELLEQTRAILAFASERPTSVFGHQLAFNLLPLSGAGVERYGGQLQALLGTDRPLLLHAVQGAVFHGLGLELYVELATDPGLAAVRRRLETHPFVEIVEDPEGLGPIDAAARDEILVGKLHPAGTGGGYWIWAVMDNLTRGGALNALAIAKAIL